MVNIIIQVIRQMRPQLYHYIRRVVYLVPHIGSTEVGERDINSLPEYVAMLIFFFYWLKIANFLVIFIISISNCPVGIFCTMQYSVLHITDPLYTVNGFINLLMPI